MIVGQNSNLGFLVPGSKLHMNQSGYLVVYDPSRAAPNDLVWQAAFGSTLPSRLVLFEVIYNSGTLHGWNLDIQTLENGVWYNRFQVATGQVGVASPPPSTSLPPTTTPPPPVGEALSEGLTELKVLGADTCIAEVNGGWSLLLTGHPDCTRVFPYLEGPGFLLADYRDAEKCLTASGTTLTWQSCEVATIWNDRNTGSGARTFPDASNRFPLSVGSGAAAPCITRASDGVGSPVYLEACGSVTDTQLWTDPSYNVIVSATSVKIDGHYGYAPSLAGGRIFWCAGLGDDYLVSAPLNLLTPAIASKYLLKPEYQFRFPGTASSPPYPPSATGKSFLSCDPHAIRTATGFDVYFTLGVKGTGAGGVGGFNEVYKVSADSAGRFRTKVGRTWRANVATKVLLPQALCAGQTDDYGCGQPTVAMNSAGRKVLESRSFGGFNQFWDISGTTPILLAQTKDVEVAGIGQDEGSSVEIFFLPGNPNTMYKLIGGPDSGGKSRVAWRKYLLTGNELRRLTSLESSVRGLWGIGHSDDELPTDGQIGCMRDDGHFPVANNGSTVLECWAASPDANSGQRLIRRPVSLVP
jgi:hypothetical protein